jgi:hypothetical protein
MNGTLEGCEEFDGERKYMYSLFAVLCGAVPPLAEKVPSSPTTAAAEAESGGNNSNAELAVDAVCCVPCQLSRQCRALDGHPSTFSCGYCLLFLTVWPVLPPCVRVMVADRFDMEEWCVTSTVKGVLCMPCSICQTNLELKRRGYNPGASCSFVSMD